MESLKQFAEDNINLDSILRFFKDHKYEVLCGSVAMATMWAVKQWYQTRDMPPGPRGWPLIGYPGVFTDGFVAGMEGLHKQYGDVVSYNAGANNYMVLLNSYDALREAFVERDTDFLRRTPPVWLKYVDFQNSLFMGEYDDNYIKYRKFCIQSLRSAGYSKDKLDGLLKTEWEELLNILDSSRDDADFYPKETFTKAMTNLVCGMMFNRRLPHTDPELEGFIKLVNDFFDSILYIEFQMLDFIPLWTLNVFFRGLKAKLQNCREKLDLFTNFIENIVREHEASYDGDDIRDFIDTCIQHGVLTSQGHRFVAHLVLSFMADAIYTAPSIFMFILMYLINYPQHQQTMRDEVNDVMKQNNGVLSLSSMGRLPFTESFINEVLRIVTPAACGAINYPKKSTTFRGYRMPKDVMILANFYGAHYDPKVFPQPEKFDPYRFLEDGKAKRVDPLVAFGIGKRKCLGEPLVRSALFYLTANMVARYSLQAADEMPDLEPVESTSGRVNKPFKMVLKHL